MWNMFPTQADTEERDPEKRRLHHAGGGPGSIISARPAFDWPCRYLDHLIKIGDPKKTS